jgi:hypothetical protein
MDSPVFSDHKRRQSPFFSFLCATSLLAMILSWLFDGDYRVQRNREHSAAWAAAK